MQVVEIKIRGHVDRDWSTLLAGLRIAHAPDGSTLLTGAVRDQSALYGLLSQLSNMGLQLVSLSSDRANKSEEVKGSMNGEGKDTSGDY